jgi:hypothetical protein
VARAGAAGFTVAELLERLSEFSPESHVQKKR